MCGLSSNQPFSDGSHKKTADEEAGKIYRYNSMEPELKSINNKTFSYFILITISALIFLAGQVL